MICQRPDARAVKPQISKTVIAFFHQLIFSGVPLLFGIICQIFSPFI